MNACKINIYSIRYQNLTKQDPLGSYGREQHNETYWERIRARYNLWRNKLSVEIKESKPIFITVNASM